MDDTSWAYHVYGGYIFNDVSNKPSVNRAGKTTICCDVKTGFPRAFGHHWRKKPYATGFTLQGQSEVAFVMEQLTPQIKGKPQGRDDKKLQVFPKPPTLTWTTTSLATPSPSRLARKIMQERGRARVVVYRRGFLRSVTIICGPSRHGHTSVR